MACGGGTAGGSVQAVRSDSSGVEIVRHDASAEGVGDFAVFPETPALRIGTIDGASEYVFGQIRDLTPLGDGGVAVLDAQASAVRVFDSDGSHRFSVGSEGDGPGELQVPLAIAALVGDTLAVYDVAQGRVTRFGPDGTLADMHSLQDVRARITVARFQADGQLVGQSRWIAPEGGRIPGPDPTLVRDTAVIVRFAADGAIRDTIDIVPGRESITSVRRQGDGFAVLRRTAAFGRSNLFAVHPEGVWSSANDRFELRLYDGEDRGLRRVVRAPGLERPVPDEVADAILSAALEETQDPTARRMTEEWFSLSPRPDIAPAFDRLLVDDAARPWVREWTPLEMPGTWWVFAANGDLEGRVVVPAGLQVMGIRCGSVWGVEQDDLDVNYVVRYDLAAADTC